MWALVLLACGGLIEVEVPLPEPEPPDPVAGLVPARVAFDGLFAVVDGVAVPYVFRGRQFPVTARFTLVAEEEGEDEPPWCTATIETWEPVEVREVPSGILALELPPGLPVDHECALSGDWPEIEEVLESGAWGMEVTPLDPYLQSILEDVEPAEWWLEHGEYALSGGPRSDVLGGGATIDLAWAWAVDERGSVLDDEGRPLGRLGTPARLAAAEVEAVPFEELRAAFVLESLGAIDAERLLE